MKQKCRRAILFDLLGLGLGISFNPMPVRAQGSPAASSREAAITDDAIAYGLEWIASQQSPSGSWMTSAWGESTGVTGLALLAFLATGHTLDAGLFSVQLTNALAWILSQQQSDGQLVNNPASEGPMFEHGICTLVLSQMLGTASLSDTTRVQSGLERAVAWIMKSQSNDRQSWYPGGWPRNPLGGGNSDLSASVWQMMALAGARQVGLDIPQSVLLRGNDYVHRCWNPRDGGFGSDPHSGATAATTAAGIVGLRISGDKKSRHGVAGRDWLISHPLTRDSSYFYFGSYFVSLAEHLQAGSAEHRLRTPLQKLILALQEPDGQWLPRFDRERQAGSVYATALAVGSLSIGLRLLPIYEVVAPPGIGPVS
jgi:hypothetical protein